jgi:hypothetical protein
VSGNKEDIKMKPLWAALLALLFASPVGALPLSYDDLPTIIVFGLSTVSYNATTSIWNEHNVAPSFLAGDFDHNTDDLNVVYDLTVSVGQDHVVHGGIFSLFGSSVKLGIPPQLLMSGHVNQLFFEARFLFKTSVKLDFAAPEIRAGNNEKFVSIDTQYHLCRSLKIGQVRVGRQARFSTLPISLRFSHCPTLCQSPLSWR